MTDANPVPPPKSSPINGIQVIPPVLASIKPPQMKSSTNLMKENLSKQINVTNKGSFTIEPNCFIQATIDFHTTFQTEPLCFYTLICLDDEFGLNHYMKNITTKNAIVSIENTTDKQRIVTLIYRVSTN